MALWTVLIVLFVSPDPESAGFEVGAQVRDEPLLAKTRQVAAGDAHMLLADEVGDQGTDSEEEGVQMSVLHHAEVVDDDKNDADEDDDGDILNVVDVEQSPISFCGAWCIPGVAIYAVTNAFTKLVSYALMLWLPFYLSEELHRSEELADLVSTLFDVGGVIGGIVFGMLSDRALRHGAGRSLVLMPILLLSALTLYLYRVFGGASLGVNALLMTLAGVFSNSAYNLINSAVAADLGTHPSLMGNAKAVSSVTGIIDGSGSVGAAVGQQIVALVADAAGWTAVFYVLIASSLLSAACLSLVAYNELRAYLASPLRHHPRHH